VNPEPFSKDHFFLTAALLLLAGVVCVIYSNTFGVSFVFDDHHFVKNDSAIRMDAITWDGIKTAALEGRPRNRLLPNASFALNYYFHDFKLAGYHAVNICLHLITGLLLFLLTLQTLRVAGLPKNLKNSATPELIAFSAALVWIVHPVHTQSVTFIYQRMTSMAALFFILSLLLYAWGRGKWRRSQGITASVGLAFLGCLVSGICALTSKQNAAMLPIIILIYEWFFFQDLSVSFSKRQMFWIMGTLLIFGGIALLYLGGSPFERILNAYTRRQFTLPERVMTEWRVVIYYITLLFYPHPGRLNLDHDYPLSGSIMQPTTLPALGAIIALIALSLYLAPRHRLISFCLLWFVLNLIIESSVVGIEIIFEHRTYLPFMLLPLAAAWLAFQYLRPKTIVVAGVCAIAVIFSVWTYQRNITWQDAAGFARDRVIKSPNKARPNMEMGVYLAHQEKYDLARQYLQKALRLNPTGRVMVNTYTDLGNVMVRTGRLKKGIDYYKKALALDPGHQSARKNMEKVVRFRDNKLKP